MVRRWIGEQGWETITSEFLAEDQQSVIAQAAGEVAAVNR